MCVVCVCVCVCVCVGEGVVILWVLYLNKCETV